MARTSTSELKTTAPQIVCVCGSFPTNGNASPATFKGSGIASVARTGTGTYRVTLSNKYAVLYSNSAHLGMGTPDGSIATIKASDVVSAKTVDIVTANASGAAADIAAATGNTVSFELFVGQSTRQVKG